jgi:hypothetical protein
MATPKRARKKAYGTASTYVAMARAILFLLAWISSFI